MDELRIANWQRTRDGEKNRNRPKRISPLANRPPDTSNQRPFEEVKAYLDRFNPAKQNGEVTHEQQPHRGASTGT